MNGSSKKIQLSCTSREVVILYRQLKGRHRNGCYNKYSILSKVLKKTIETRNDVIWWGYFADALEQSLPLQDQLLRTEQLQATIENNEKFSELREKFFSLIEPFEEWLENIKEALSKITCIEIRHKGLTHVPSAIRYLKGLERLFLGCNLLCTLPSEITS
jgi:hypothetical protein